MSQNATNTVLSVLVVIALGLGGWVLQKVSAQDAARAAQAQATLGLEKGSALVLDSLKQQGARLSAAEQEIAVLRTEASAARRDIERLERGNH